MTLSEFKDSLRGKNIYVVGLSGQEGYAVGEFLHGLGATFTACDFSENREKFDDNFKFSHEYLSPEEQEKRLQEIFSWPITLYFKEDYLKNVESADIVYAPQSYHRYPANQKLLDLKSKKLVRLIQLFFELSPCPIIGITGTVGKSTVTALIAKILEDAGRVVYQTGNDRENIWDFQKLLSMPKNGILVLEISNRQLMDFPYSPHVAVVTNISPHHGDEHENFQDYIETKKNILHYQKPEDFAIIPSHLMFGLDQTGLGKKLFFDAKNVKNIQAKLLGTHNLENIAAAVTATSVLGIDKDFALKSTSSFPGLPHRLEFIREISGIRFYNDSKSTDPVSTIAAIKSFGDPKILILGGRRKDAKEADFRGLAEAICQSHVKCVFLIGETGPLIKEALENTNCSEECGQPVLADSLEEAVKKSYALGQKGDVILLSPACESFGLFRDFRERGEKFKEIVAKLIS